MLELTTYSSLLLLRPTVRWAPNIKPFHLADLVIKPKRKHKSHKFVNIWFSSHTSLLFPYWKKKESTVSNIFLLGYAIWLWAGIAEAVQRLATGWTVGVSNPDGGEIFPHPSRPALRPNQPPIQWVPGFFPGSKTVGALCWLPTLILRRS
jgi:hypothetical protein